MPAKHDVVVIGAGHNGLVAAFYLARAGVAPLVLERRDTVGGAATTGEICPGFRGPTLAHLVRLFDPQVARDLHLDRRLDGAHPDVRLFAPSPDGGMLLVYEDVRRTADALAALSVADARAYAGFRECVDRIAPVLRELQAMTPPSVQDPSAGDLLNLLKVGRRFRRLERRHAYRLLRWVPLPVGDLVSEWFETDLLRAAVAAPGLIGTFAGPRSVGTGATWLWQAAADYGLAGLPPMPRGGPGALVEAVANAARAAGAELRTGAEVTRIIVKNGAAAGVALASGEEVPATTIVANADPRRTLLQLVDPGELDPPFLASIRHYKCVGTAAKINLALDALPEFTALARCDRATRQAALSGSIHIGPGLDYLERAFDAAKYGEYSTEPYLDVTIPSMTDPSLAPPGRHVMSIYMQFAPYRLRDGDWRSRRDEFADRVIRILAVYAPNLESLTTARQIITPLDLEETYALTGGHIFHGEPSLNQLFTMRPVYGWAQYRTPIRGLYLCGAGTHPGGGVTGLPGRNASREILSDLGKKRR